MYSFLLPTFFFPSCHPSLPFTSFFILHPPPLPIITVFSSFSSPVPLHTPLSYILFFLPIPSFSHILFSPSLSFHLFPSFNVFSSSPAIPFLHAYSLPLLPVFLFFFFPFPYLISFNSVSLPSLPS